VIALPGVSLLLLGARRTRALAGVLALAIFLIPTPSSTSDPIWLAEGSSVIAEQILDAIDIPATRRETYFLTRAGEISVSQNCSGLSTVHASFALAFALLLAGRGGRRRWLPLAVAYPATLALNALRLVGIIWASHHMGMEFLHTALHGFSGLAVIWSTLALVWLSSDHAAVRKSLS
jgi:exosortase